MIERYNPNSRYKRKSRERMMSFLTFLILLGLAMALGYWIGRQSSAATISSQATQIKMLEDDSEALQETMTAARTKAQTADMRYQKLQREMEALVPSEGPLRDLLRQIRARLEEGASPERLAFVIKSAQPPRNCTDPETKRFVVNTPTYKGSDNAISIDEGLITVSARGASAQNKNGQAEAWYDPGQPVTVQFKKHGGDVETKESVLPLSSSFVVQDREYRFTLSSGARSFIKVTYDSCDYP